MSQDTFSLLNLVATALAAVAGATAAVAAFMSWAAMREANRTTGFEVYQRVQRFLEPWARDGTPDLKGLIGLVEAWDRSHFLFDTAVSQHLRQIWLDALQADLAYRTISGVLAGDRDEALKLQRFYMERYFSDDGTKFRDVFMNQMKLQSGSVLFKRNS